MSPRHFSKTMFSPYFQSEHYKNESKEIAIQRKLEKTISGLLFWKKHKKNDTTSNN